MKKIIFRKARNLPLMIAMAGILLCSGTSASNYPNNKYCAQKLYVDTQGNAVLARVQSSCMLTQYIIGYKEPGFDWLDSGSPEGQSCAKSQGSLFVTAKTRAGYYSEKTEKISQTERLFYINRNENLRGYLSEPFESGSLTGYDGGAIEEIEFSFSPIPSSEALRMGQSKLTASKEGLDSNYGGSGNSHKFYVSRTSKPVYISKYNGGSVIQKDLWKELKKQFNNEERL